MHATECMFLSRQRATRRKAMETTFEPIWIASANSGRPRATRRKAMETELLRSGIVNVTEVANGRRAERQWRRVAGDHVDGEILVSPTGDAPKGNGDPKSSGAFSVPTAVANGRRAERQWRHPYLSRVQSPELGRQRATRRKAMETRRDKNINCFQCPRSPTGDAPKGNGDVKPFDL